MPVISYESDQGAIRMSKEEDNKVVVGRWFTEFWGKTVNLGVIDEIAAPDMLLKYSLHEPRRGRDDIRAFMTDFLDDFAVDDFQHGGACEVHLASGGGR